MSNADDNSGDSDSSTQPAQQRQRKTILGLGFATPMPEELAVDARDGPAARDTTEDIDLDDGSTRPVEDDSDESPTSPDEFPDAETELVATAEDVHDAVDRAWEEMFVDEDTDPVGTDLSFPDDQRRAQVRTIAGRPVPADPDPPFDEAETTELGGEDTDPGQLAAATLAASDQSWEEGIEAIDLDDDPLPEPIHDPSPTLDDATDPSDATDPMLRATDPTDATDPMSRALHTPYPGDNKPITEFEDAATELLDSPFESDPSVAKLVALDGPAAGQEFFAAGLRNTIGRGTNNTIVVPDVAMSRQHFEIVRKPDESFSLVDLQSINGTLLNGTKVREADLFHGDRVAAGKSRFQFVVTGNAAPPSRQRKLVPAATATLNNEPIPPAAGDVAAGTSVNRVLAIVSVVAVIVSLVLFGAVAILKLREAPEAPGADGESADATAIYLRGVDAVKARDWDLAERTFREAQRIDPKVEGVEGQLRRIEAERAAQKLLARAKTERDEGVPDTALATLQQIPSASVYHADARQLARELRNERVRTLYQQAQVALADGDREQARTVAEQILKVVPSHRGALAIQDQLADAADAADVGR